MKTCFKTATTFLMLSTTLLCLSATGLLCLCKCIISLKFHLNIILSVSEFLMLGIEADSSILRSKVGFIQLKDICQAALWSDCNVLLLLPVMWPPQLDFERFWCKETGATNRLATSAYFQPFKWHLIFAFDSQLPRSRLISHCWRTTTLLIVRLIEPRLGPSTPKMWALTWRSAPAWKQSLPNRSPSLQTLCSSRWARTATCPSSRSWALRLIWMRSTRTSVSRRNISSRRTSSSSLSTRVATTTTKRARISRICGRKRTAEWFAFQPQQHCVLQNLAFMSWCRFRHSRTMRSSTWGKRGPSTSRDNRSTRKRETIRSEARATEGRRLKRKPCTRFIIITCTCKIITL